MDSLWLRAEKKSSSAAQTAPRDAAIVHGYLPPTGFVTGTGRTAVLELLDLEGRVVPIPLREVRMVSFVREFNTGDHVNPERLLRKTFLARPRAEGLQVRITFHDGDVLEGLATNDISLLDCRARRRGHPVRPARHPLQHPAHLRPALRPSPT